MYLWSRSRNFDQSSSNLVQIFLFAISSLDKFVFQNNQIKFIRIISGVFPKNLVFVIPTRDFRKFPFSPLICRDWASENVKPIRDCPVREMVLFRFKTYKENMFRLVTVCCFMLISHQHC